MQGVSEVRSYAIVTMGKEGNAKVAVSVNKPGYTLSRGSMPLL